MKTIEKKKASGTLGRIVAEMDSNNLAKVRNRMMVAAMIAEAMQARHLNQKQFAKLMGRTESEISDWLSGDRNFTIDTLFEIGQALGVSFLSASLHYSIAGDSERYPAYELEPMIASEP